MNANTKTRILVVDDDVSLSETVQDVLTQTGRFEVETENDPLKACAAVNRFHPQLILLDVIMPFMDGGTVASKIREDPRFARVPVIFFTSILDQEEAAVRGNTLGNDPVLAKPISISALIAKIDEVLANAKR
jgi:DNA-binding response OmpR family regulator